MLRGRGEYPTCRSWSFILWYMWRGRTICWVECASVEHRVGNFRAPHGECFYNMPLNLGNTAKSLLADGWHNPGSTGALILQMPMKEVSSCQLLIGSKWLEAENCFIWNYFCLRNFLTLKDLSSFFCFISLFLLKIDYFFVQHILIIFSPPSTLLSPSSPTLPSGSTLFLFLIRKLLRANNQTW